MFEVKPSLAIASQIFLESDGILAMQFHFNTLFDDLNRLRRHIPREVRTQRLMTLHNGLPRSLKCFLIKLSSQLADELRRVDSAVRLRETVKENSLLHWRERVGVPGRARILRR